MKKPPSRRREATLGRGLSVLVLQSQFNEKVVEGLVLGALEYSAEVGATAQVELVPGAFELPLVAQTAAFTGRYDAIVALGAVIKGETDHYAHIARESARGIMDVSLTTGVPVAFGVLTVTREAHALARSRPGRHNKGREAMSAAIDTALLLRKINARPRTRPRAASKKKAR